MRKRTFELRSPIHQQNAIQAIQQILPDPTKPIDQITQQRLKEVLLYDELTGKFTWKVKKCQRMNAGDIAGHKSSEGYWVIKVDGKLYKAHRLAWLYMNGSLPKSDIDHINLVRDDNRIANLRLATRSQNIQNVNKKANNKSGYKGVSWDKKSRKWRAQIVINKRKVNLGFYDDPKEAHKVYANKADECFGEFARY
ncbi:HNH endonuclease [Escherichia coli]|nr:HNH endonuclease [Escherichia coli]NJV22772.1 HNH endonuclease [Escherichia coli]NJV69225.1 HNH endonuclease [Escherichia coli]NJV87186.1 HNH endonuclease [Escherichia coli]TZD60788.1 HNH endonuclease [Escherichia coli]